MKKILKIIGIVILCIGVIALLFIKFWPSLGGNVNKEGEKNYKTRNSLYKKGIFHGNPEIHKRVNIKMKKRFLKVKYLFIS